MKPAVLLLLSFCINELND